MNNLNIKSCIIQQKVKIFIFKLYLLKLYYEYLEKQRNGTVVTNIYDVNNRLQSRDIALSCPSPKVIHMGFVVKSRLFFCKYFDF